MRHELRLADIGEGLDEAEIIAWRVNVGDRVARDQPHPFDPAPQREMRNTPVRGRQAPVAHSPSTAGSA